MTLPPKSERDVLAELIDAEKSLPDPPPEVGQRVLSRLSASLALPAGPAADVPCPAGPAASPPPAGSGLVEHGVAGLARRALLPFLVGAAVGAAGYGTVQHLRHEVAPAPPAGPAASAPAPAVPPAPAPAPPERAPQPPPATAPAAAPSRASEREAPPAGSRDRGLAAERKLVEMARTALARGQTDSALATLRRHAHAFPRGQLAEERDSLHVQALVAKGDFSAARQRAVRFHRQFPGSLFSPVVDQAVRSIP
jgi:pyruvate/2-oxoglutarate dehydrogenase complex dihydrolipoamide acyltransferase (E2) component